MTREKLDTLWFQAMRQSIEGGEDFIRYHFADLVTAEKDREILALQTENERLRAALKKYGRHLDDCALTLGGYPCTCGFKRKR